ncbi:MAG: hypothetical protein BGO78_10270 [Chloroflexi bacterium 44-23]|nr:MAG: hypothetical protein BGO78_10270 [Chloroflexi bacterium 44-23]
MKKIPIIPLLPILALLFIIATVALWYLDPLREFGGERDFQVSLQSSIFADYGSDHTAHEKHVPLSLNIIAGVLRDIQDAIDTGKILGQTQTPVQTMSILPPSSTAISPTKTVNSILPSGTANPATTEPTQTATVTPTQEGNHISWTATATRVASTITPTPGVGVVSPTPTPTQRSQPTHVPSVSSTFTVLPSLTFTPFVTATPFATRVPATATPLPATHTAQPSGYPAPATPAATPTSVIGYP